MSILKFPSELIVKIAYHVGPEDMSLTNFAMTCSQLYTLLLPYIIDDEVYCLQQMVRNRRLKILTEPYGDETFDLLGIEDLDDLYHLPMRMIMVKPMADDKDLRCLRRLLYRATNVATVLFSLDDFNASLPPRSRARKLATLFNVVAEKKTKFQIVGHPFDWDGEAGPFMFQIFNNLQGIRRSRDMDTRYSGQYELFDGKYQPTSGTQYKSTTRKVKEIYNLAKESFPGQLTSTAPTVPPEVVVKYRKGRFELPLLTQSRLTLLEIECPILFLASFSRNTFMMINNSRLTELIIGHIIFSEYEWSCILSDISCPALISLEFVNLAIAFSDLRKFLTRHPRISTLDLSSNTFMARKFKLPVRGLRKFLPNLVYLKGKPSFITAFLKGINRFPDLTTVYLKVLGGPKGHEPGLFRDVYKGKTLSPFYFALMTIPPGRIALRVDSLYDSSFIEWMEGSKWNHDDRRYRSFPSIHTLFIERHSFNVREPEVLQGILRVSGWMPKSSGDSLVLRTRVEFPAFQEPEIVQAFLWRRCPNLKTIEYNRSRLLGDREDCTVERPAAQ